MVTRSRGEADNENRSNDNEENRNPDVSPSRQDAVVMAVAMATAAFANPAARQPRDDSPGEHEAHTTRTPAHETAHEPAGDSSTPEVGSSQRNLPPSPLVTPPIAAPGDPPSIPMPASAQASRPSNSRTGKRGVPHVYHDYSQVPDQVGYIRKKTGGVTQPFPEKLHWMLGAETSPASQAIVSWLPHGRAFIVRKPKEFTKDIMPRYFRQTKLTSFQRQLNLYGFRRITQGADAGAYYHEMFLRGRPSLCQRMVRQKVKGTGHKQPADADTEPNFYAMPPIDETEIPATPSVVTTPLAAAAAAAVAAATAAIDTPCYATAAPAPAPAPAAPTPAPAPPTISSSSQPSGTSSLDIPSVHDDPSSPGLQSVHGAAHLLHGIASGFRQSNLPSSSSDRYVRMLPSAPFLGQAALSTSLAPGAATTITTSADAATGISDNRSSVKDKQQKLTEGQTESAPASFLPPEALPDARTKPV